MPVTMRSIVTWTQERVKRLHSYTTALSQTQFGMLHTANYTQRLHHCTVIFRSVKMVEHRL